MYDVLIIGGSVSGVSCALILGSANQKPFVLNKKIGIIMHQKASALQNAIYNNAYGIAPGKLGSELLKESSDQLQNLYPHVEQMANEKVMEIVDANGCFTLITNKNSYKSRIICIGIGASNPISVKGLNEFVIPHKKAAKEKNNIQLLNEDHLVKEGIYVMGPLAGHRSQLSIAAGSGAAVATDILTLWNGGNPVQVHDALIKL